jgi:hypothetical protein
VRLSSYDHAARDWELEAAADILGRFMLKTFMRERIDLVPAGTSRNANGRPVVSRHGST